MSMDHWDSMIAPVLTAIEGRARWAVYYAGEIVSAVNMLPGRPSFETRAEDVLRDAEIQLEHALESVRFARQAYSGKRILEAAE